MAVTYLNEIRIEPKGFEQTLKNFGQMTPDLKESIREAIRKTIPMAEMFAIQEIMIRYAISGGNLMQKSSRNGKWRFKEKLPTASNLSGGIQVIGTRMPVMRFHVRPLTPPNQLGVPVAMRTPVYIETKKGSIQYGKPNVFLARMKSGHIGVYKRKIPNPGGPRKIRPDGQPTQLPITEEYMLSVPEMLAGKEVRKKLDERITKYMRKAWLTELQQISFRYWATAAMGM
jgi:hypothetical protein